MKRVVALSVAVTYLSIATVFAQEPIVRSAGAFRPVTFAAPTAPTPAVSLVPNVPPLRQTAMAAAAEPARIPMPRTSLAAVAALAAPGKSSKSFWKTPWPYVIAGAVVVGAVVVAKKGYKSNTPGCSDPSCSIY